MPNNRFSSLGGDNIKNKNKDKDKDKDNKSSSGGNIFKSSNTPRNTQTTQNIQKSSRFNFDTNKTSKKYVPPGARRRNTENKGNSRYGSRHNSGSNTFNWQQKKKQAEEEKRISKIVKTEENFPTLGGPAAAAASSSAAATTSTSTSTTTEKSEPLTRIQQLTNTKTTQSVLEGYKNAIKKKREQKKAQARVDPGWVTMRFVKGKIIKLAGPKTKVKRKPVNHQVAINKMMREMDKSRIEGWERDGFWDNRLDELEEIWVEADRSDTESSYDEEEENEEDDEYYDGGGGGGKRWWTS